MSKYIFTLSTETPVEPHWKHFHSANTVSALEGTIEALHTQRHRKREDITKNLAMVMNSGRTHV